MKMFDFSHWESIEDNKGLLFFAQSMEEMLFHYGHDSLKVPALNFRFLCVEAKNVIVKIDEGIVDKANLQPLIKELFKSFSNDPVAKSLYGTDFNHLFFSKNAKGEIDRSFRVNNKDFDFDVVSINKLSDVLDYLITDMDIGDKYYATLKLMLISQIKKVPCDLECMGDIYQLTRILLADLINYCYSQEFIYMVVMDIFFTNSKPVCEIEKILDEFFSFFDFNYKSYRVIMPLKNKKLFFALSNLNSLNIKINNRKLFGGTCEWVIEFDGINAYDPYGARNVANRLLNIYISLIQYNDHKNKFFNPQHAMVKLENSEKTYNISTPLTPIQRGKNLSKALASSKIASLLQTLPVLDEKIINVINLHSSAILSNDLGNQLINLWTIVEILIPIERKDTFSKVNQICNVLTTVLNAQYAASLIEQLLSDINHCLPEYVDTILNSIHYTGDVTEKLTAVLTLDEFKGVRNELISFLTTFPLLQYRIQHYSTIFSCPKKYKEFLGVHRERLNWHIVRIYRSRNMYVHDGSLFPYKDIVIQNLHYYVDVLIDTINNYINNGYNSINNIYTLLLQKELHNLLELEVDDIQPESLVRIVLGTSTI